MSPLPLRRIAPLLAAVLLAGCAATDPLERQGLWRPNGSNDTDYAAMVADPADLVAGRGLPGGDGAEAAAAIERLRTDKVKPMQYDTLTFGSGSGGGIGQGGSGSGGSGSGSTP